MLISAVLCILHLLIQFQLPFTDHVLGELLVTFAADFVQLALEFGAFAVDLLLSYQRPPGQK